MIGKSLINWIIPVGMLLNVAQFATAQAPHLPLVVNPGSMLTVAGNGMAGYLGDGGLAPEASLRSPSGVAVDSFGNIYIADTDNNVIRCVWKASGTITTIAGTGLPGYSGDGASALLAMLNTPMGLAVDSMNNLLIADYGNHVIRKVDSQGTITTLVGNGSSTDQTGTEGDGSQALAATLWFPTAVTLDTHGNLYIADSSNSRIRYVDAKTQIITTVAGTGDFGYAGDGGPAINATLNFPLGVAVAPNGDIYIADSQNSAIRKVSSIDGSITSLKFQDANGTNYQATFDPTDLTIAGDGSLYVSDDSISVIWRVNPASGVRSIEVGIDPSLPQAYADSALGMASYNGPHSLLLNLPEAVTLDGKGNLIIADSGNAAVRVETFQSGMLEYFANNSMTATLTNPNPVPVAISGTNLTGSNAPDFTLTNRCLGQLAAAANCTITVAFSPSTLNLESAFLKINDNVTSGPQTITLVGVGTGVAVVSPSPPFLQFAAQAMQASPPQTISLTNTGSAAANIAQITLNGVNARDFNMSSSCGPTLTPGTTCNLQVSFTPSSATAETAFVQISQNVYGQLQQIALNGIGTGVPALVASPSSLGFPAQDIGENSTSRMLMLANTGSAPVTLSVSLGGTNIADFIQSGNCPQSLAAGTSCSLFFSFKPSVVGQETALITIKDNTATSPHLISISGTGLARLSIASLMFIPGGDFETGTLGPWQVFQGNALAGWSSHSGQYGLSTGSNTIVFQSITGLNPGQQYVLSAWVMDPIGNNRAAALAVNGANGWEQSSFLPVTSWQQFFQTGTASAAGSLTVDLVEYTSSATLYWDDVNLTPIAPPNGTFEAAVLAPWNLWQGYAYISASAHSGRHGLTMNPSTTVYQVVNGLIPGQRYALSGWILDAGTSNGGVTLAANGLNGWEQGTFQAGSQWKQVTQDCTASLNGTLVLDLVTSANPEAIYWDDVTLTPVLPVNGDFETAELTPWNLWQGGASVSTESYSGQYSMGMDPNTIIYQLVTGLIPWQGYTLSAWVKTRDSTALAATLALNGTAGWAQTIFNASPLWQQFSAAATASANGTLTVDMVSGTGVGELLWDGITLIPAPPVNAGFESGSLVPWGIWQGSAYIGWAAHTGQHGLTMQANTIVNQIVTGLIPGQKYSLSAWVIASQPGQNSVELAMYGANGWEQSTFASGSSWQQFSQTGTASSTGTLVVDLVTLNTTAPIYWDDLNLTPVQSLKNPASAPGLVNESQGILGASTPATRNISNTTPSAGNGPATAGPFSLTGQTGSSPATPGAGTDTLFFNSANNIPEALDASGNLYAMPPASILTAPANGFYAGSVRSTTGAPTWRPLSSADVSPVFSSLIAATPSSSLSDGSSLVRSTSPNTFTSSLTVEGPVSINNSKNRPSPAHAAQTTYLDKNHLFNLLSTMDWPGSLYAYSSEANGHVQMGFYNTRSSAVSGVLGTIARSIFGYSASGSVCSLTNNFSTSSPRNCLDDGSGNANMIGQLKVGGFASTVNVITSADPTLNTDLIVSNSATAPFTLTMLASPVLGTIKEITNESTHAITIAVPGGVTLAGAVNGTITLAAATSVLPTKVTLQYDGSTAWHVI